MQNLTKFSFIQHQFVNPKLEDPPSPIMTPTPLGNGTGDDVPVVHDAAPPNHDPHLAIPSLHVARAPPLAPIQRPTPSTSTAISTGNEPDIGDAQSDNETVFDPSIKPFTVSISSETLPKYSLTNLSIESYYDDADVECKPLTLILAGIGIPTFPKPKEIENITDVANVIKANKSMLYQKKDIIPTTRFAKPGLQKEVIRRSLLQNVDPLLRVKHWTLGKCTEWLQKTPPPEDEHDSIIDSFNRLKTFMREHYLEKSGSKDANIWRLIRLYECCDEKALNDGIGY